MQIDDDVHAERGCIGENLLDEGYVAGQVDRPACSVLKMLPHDRQTNEVDVLLSIVPKLSQRRMMVLAVVIAPRRAKFTQI